MTDQLSFLDARGRVRRNNPPTAHAAAAADPRLRGQRLQCLAVLFAAGESGLTPHEAWRRTSCAYPHVVTTRFDELSDAGLVERTDRTRTTTGRHKALVWTITEAGRETAARLEAAGMTSVMRRASDELS